MKRLVLIGLLACGGHAHDHAEATRPPAASFTEWTAHHELFVEHPPFVVGQRSTLAVHVTTLAKHAPVAEGTLTVSLRMASGGAALEATAKPERPGVFAPELAPTTAGPCKLTLKLAGKVADELTVDCVVHATAAAIPAEEPEPPGRITYPKEAAWTTDFLTEPVGEQELVPTLRASGEIRATAGREARLTASTHGRVVVESPPPVLGMKIAAGQVLARIAPQVEAAADRPALQGDAQAARIELAAAEAQLARTERLWAERAIPEKQLEEAKTRVALARSRVASAAGRLGQLDASAAGRGGRATFQIRSPLAGTLVAIAVSSGQSVEDGEELFRVVDLDRVWLHADVFEPDIAAVENATRASFRVDGIADPIRVEPPEGRLVTIGKLVDEKTRTVPVIFELPNPDQRLRIGSFAIVWIETGAPVRRLAIPETAIVDDGGRRVAYVQVEGESFERRVLGLGVRSGGWVEITSGLAKGEHVVVRGAYEIKLAASGGAVPEHGHAH